MALRLALSLLCLGLPALAMAQTKPTAGVSAQNPAGVQPDASDAMVESLKANLNKLDNTLYNPAPAQPLPRGPAAGSNLPPPVDVMPPGSPNNQPAAINNQPAASGSGAGEASAEPEPAPKEDESLKSGNLETHIYKNYLAKAETLSKSLIDIKNRLQQDASDDNPANASNMADGVGSGRLSLQQLGALTQSLSAENERFEDSFQYGENKFSSYQAIETAVKNLEDAVYYWREANRFRALYRKTAIEHVQDDEVLQVKILKAMTAIDQLDNIMKIRGALDRLEAEYTP